MFHTDTNSNFTFHNVSINTASFELYDSFVPSFTFHNVSINTTYKIIDRNRNSTLHSTMFLLIPRTAYSQQCGVFTLHSTMFLLILWATSNTMASSSAFTFHNVSINTVGNLRWIAHDCTLHSTMFLLILALPFVSFPSASDFTFHNVSINTVKELMQKGGLYYFTFHNVSINTSDRRQDGRICLSLHSTMFLLIRQGIVWIRFHGLSLHSTMFLLIQF